MKNFVLILSAVVLLPACSPEASTGAEDATVAESTISAVEVVESHMKAFDGNNMDEIVGDYADDVVFILPNEVRQGRQAVYDFFAPQRAGDNPPALTYEIESTEGSVVVAPWALGAGTPGEMTGRDVFIVEDGKIQSQVVFIESVPG